MLWACEIYLSIYTWKIHKNLVELLIQNCWVCTSNSIIPFYLFWLVYGKISCYSYLVLKLPMRISPSLTPSLHELGNLSPGREYSSLSPCQNPWFLIKATIREKTWNRTNLYLLVTFNMKTSSNNSLFDWFFRSSRINTNCLGI